MHSLVTKNLVKSYSQRKVVNEVSISIHSGEIVGLLGPNGAGKTTTFYMCVGLVGPESGAILLDNQDITKEPMYARARLGLSYLPQEASVFRKLSVEDNIMAIVETLDLPSREAKNQKLNELLSELGITHVRKTLASALSGGERRRVEIARALVRSPAFILLDEPFAGIDPIAIKDIQGIIRTLKAKNIGVLITDHNVRETLGICDRGYILVDGKVLVAGEPEVIAQDERARRYYLGENFNI